MPDPVTKHSIDALAILSRRRLIAIAGGLSAAIGGGLLFGSRSMAGGEQPVCPEKYTWDEVKGRCVPLEGNQAAPSTGGDTNDDDDDDDLGDDESGGEKKEGGSGGSACFLTTACCEEIGLKDDCFELTTLRRFRDQYLVHVDGGLDAVRTYYALAPAILRAIPLQLRRAELLTLYTFFILPSAICARLNLNTAAHWFYCAGMQRLGRRYLSQSSAAVEGP